MNKILRFSVPIILACLFLGMLLYLVGSSNQVMASANPLSKISISKELNKKTEQPQADLVVTTLDFALQPACTHLSGLDFTLLPANPIKGESVTFSAIASGTPPIDFEWQFGDGVSGNGATVSHAYADSGNYSVNLTATNACGDGTITKDITIPQLIRQFFLPLIIAGVRPDPTIQGMIDQVTETQVYTYVRQLAGELPVWVDNGWYTIPSRYTFSGTPIQKATNFVGQHMQDLGLDVEYHTWYDYTNPNVIGQITGLVNPDDIYIIGAHLDDIAGTPGADDNASGSTATLLAADILSQYQWGCTLRFAFWTGEEEGGFGSRAYARRAKQNGENILGYLNLDMISWNTLNSQPGIDLWYYPVIPPTHDLANLYADVVDAYNINLDPEFLPWGPGSDHYSFLVQGYTSIMAIEDLLNDGNPYSHSPQDTPAHTDPTYFTNFVKASIATFAHASGCLITTGTGSLDGHVTAAGSGAPIEGATVIAKDEQGHYYPDTTDASGYYTRTLMAGIYDVTASAYSYLPQTVSGVTITNDTITTQDFALLTAPTYTISGTVTENGTGLPLLAEIRFAGSPVTVWSDPSTGFYQAVLPEGNYTMQVRADLHQSQSLEIVLDHDQTQNFSLEARPCILLVDDDGDIPDVNSYYTSALDSLGADYDIWDTSTGDPTFYDISGYKIVLWYIGYMPWNTFTDSNENDVAAYLDAGGNFFLSSQGYLYDMGLTFFNHNYLHISSVDLRFYGIVITVTGQNVFSGLGPYSLTYPFQNLSPIFNPDAQAQLAFIGFPNPGDVAISYAGENFNTVFFGYPFEAIPQLADRHAVMGRLLDFFGGCQPNNGWLASNITDADFAWRRCPDCSMALR